MLIAERLIDLRKKKGLLQKDVAGVFGLERTTYGKYESKGIQPPTDMIVKLAEYFNVSTDYLLGKSNDPISHNNIKKEPTPRERLADEFVNLLNEVPDDKLENFRVLFRATVDALK
ncbi:MAG: helix-turn-helix domain-containing protein [Defluviitaleaceae bacterium]|nr:helix-turn-helix domain-containing protein [Defluviitaleaceae bacterium]